MISLSVNGTEHRLEVSSDMRLLWVLRDILGLTGTKFGCGMSQCGSCTVHLDGEAARSCVIPVSVAAGKHYNHRGPVQRRQPPFAASLG